MTADEFNLAIVERLRRDPFRSFIVELLDGQQIQFDRPSLAIRGGAAGGFSRGKQIVSLDFINVHRIFDALPTYEAT